MKKGISLTLLIATLLTTNLTIKPESVIHRTSAMAKHSKTKVRRMWFCLRHQNQCSKQEVTEAKRWVKGASATAIATTLFAVGIIATVLTVRQEQSKPLPDRETKMKEVVRLLTEEMQVLREQDKANKITKDEFLKKQLAILSQVQSILIEAFDNLQDGEYVLGLGGNNLMAHTNYLELKELK